MKHLVTLFNEIIASIQATLRIFSSINSNTRPLVHISRRLGQESIKRSGTYYMIHSTSGKIPKHDVSKSMRRMCLTVRFTCALHTRS